MYITAECCCQIVEWFSRYDLVPDLEVQGREESGRRCVSSGQASLVIAVPAPSLQVSRFVNIS